MQEGNDDNNDGVHSSVPGGEVDKGLEDSEDVEPPEDDILSEPDKFYGRLTEFFDSTGLSLILNARETSLDLFLLYKEVASRGGFQQGIWDVLCAHEFSFGPQKWNELVGVLTFEAEAKTNEKLATQLQRLYANLLFQFEQSNMPRTPTKSSRLPGLHISNIKGSSMKRMLQDGENCPKAKKLQKKYVMSSNGVITKEQKSKPKNESKKDPMAPLGHRSPYQIFLKMECDRLKKLHGDTQESQNTKKSVRDAWRHLSDVNKQPYIEERRTDRERYSREMKAYQEHLKRKLQETGIPPSNTADVYKVTLNQETASNDTEAPLSSERAIELATEMLRTVPVDILLNLNWDDLCGSVHVSEIK